MIELKHISKTFSTADGTVEALKDVSLTVEDGEIFGIIGMSGAGKSPLVRCINMLERPSEGEVIIDGENVGALSPAALRAVRRKVTMIFQSFNLLMQRSCLANVCFPLRLAGVPREAARKRAMELLGVVGLADRAGAYPAQLSGGQKQRVAIARALATDPKVLLCDEATSALDPNTTHAILSLIRDINKRLGITVVIITHQMSVVEEVCSRVAILDGGTVAEIGPVAEVFTRPASAAAKRLVLPEEDLANLPAAKGERLVRVTFGGATAAGAPLVTRMAIDEGIAANIRYASTRTLGDLVYGSMILGIPDEGDTVARAVRYLSRDNITVQEVENDVR